jgi:hypothetical protein
MLADLLRQLGGLRNLYAEKCAALEVHSHPPAVQPWWASEERRGPLQVLAEKLREVERSENRLSEKLRTLSEMLGEIANSARVDREVRRQWTLHQTPPSTHTHTHTFLQFWEAN